MVFESGILTAEHHSDYPEAVERALNDTNVVLLHTPDMVSEAACIELEGLGKYQKRQAEQAKLIGHNILSREISDLDDVNQVIADWVARNPSLRRYGAVTGPEFERTRVGEKLVHVDGTGYRPKTGPLGLSISTNGNAVWSGERPPTDLVGLFGFESMIKRAKLNNTIDAYKNRPRSGVDVFDLPSWVMQRKGDGVWLPTFPTPVIHKVRLPRVEVQEIEAVDDNVRRAAFFEYNLWRNVHRIPPALAPFVLANAA